MRPKVLLVCALAALLATAPSALAATAESPPARTATPTVLDGDAMWIWVLSRSSRGDWAAIVRKAKKYGVETVIMKGADGRTRWSQFSQAFVDYLHANGLRVCAFQFIYGLKPKGEANVGARLANLGADCLLIDAEGHYEGRYWAAQRYMNRLRLLLGPDYPLVLTSFPYVHYHPGFPYSVFLAPGNAQLNAPQVYWRAIGTSVDTAMSITHRFNRIYGRPILPIGQVYQDPPKREIVRFRALANAYGARGVSWWVWQSSSTREWRAVGDPLGVAPLFPPAVRYPTLSRGWRGDPVVWAQQHLVSAGFPVKVTGVFGAKTKLAVQAFQTSVGLPAPGKIGARTWQALLPYGPAQVTWTKRGRAKPVVALPARRGRALRLPEPRSALLPARRNEIARAK